jgi:hypothetical protein
MTRLSRRGFLAVSAGLALGVRPEAPATTVQWEKETLPTFDIRSLPLHSMYRAEYEGYVASLERYISLRLGVPSRAFLGGHR